MCCVVLFHSKANVLYSPRICTSSSYPLVEDFVMIMTDWVDWLTDFSPNATKCYLDENCAVHLTFWKVSLKIVSQNSFNKIFISKLVENKLAHNFFLKLKVKLRKNLRCTNKLFYDNEVFWCNLDDERC